MDNFMNFIVTPRNKLWYKAGASLPIFPPYVLCLFCCVGVPPSLPLCKLPLPFLALEKACISGSRPRARASDSWRGTPVP